MQPEKQTAALAAACAAFVAVPNLGALLGRGEQTDRYDTVITPPDYAFAIWGPIFAACAADVWQRWRRPSDHSGSDTATARPLAAAYVLNTAWSVAAQTDRFALTPILLPAAAACSGIAHRNVQSVEGPRPSTVGATGLLLGWTTLASAVNIAAEVVRRGAPAEGRSAAATAAAGLVAAGSAVGAVTARSTHGALPVAVAAGWGLASTAADRRRPWPVRTLAGVATAGVIAAWSRRRLG